MRNRIWFNRFLISANSDLIFFRLFVNETKSLWSCFNRSSLFFSFSAWVNGCGFVSVFGSVCSLICCFGIAQSKWLVQWLSKSLVEFIVYVFDCLVPTSAASAALAVLLAARAIETLLRDSGGHKPKTLCNGAWGGSINRKGRQPNRQVVRHLAVLFEIVCNDEVFPSWEPKPDVWQCLCNRCNFLQVFNALEVTWIMPAKETALLPFADCDNHSFNPTLVLKLGEAPFHGSLYGSKYVPSLESVTLGANSVFGVPEFLPRDAIPCRNGKGKARHLARWRQAADEIVCLFRSEGSLRLHGSVVAETDAGCKRFFDFFALVFDFGPPGSPETKSPKWLVFVMKKPDPMIGSYLSYLLVIFLIFLISYSLI